MMVQKKPQTNPYDSLGFQKKKISCSSGFMEWRKGEWSDIELIPIKSRIYFKYSVAFLGVVLCVCVCLCFLNKTTSPANRNFFTFYKKQYAWSDVEREIEEHVQ